MKKIKTPADWKEFEKREAIIKSRSQYRSHLSASLLTLVFIIGLFQSDLQNLRGILVDALFRSQLNSKPHPAITLVAYDETTAAKHQGARKLPASEIIDTVLTINQDKPLAIAILAPINEKFYSDSELSDMADAFSQIPAIFIGFTDNESLGRNAPRPLRHTARYLPGYVSRDTFSYGADSVSRRVMLNIDGTPSVYSELAKLFNDRSNASKSFPTKRVERFGEATQTYINWQGRTGTYKLLSMGSLSSNTKNRENFNGKIVLIGTALDANKDSDYIFTPYSRKPFQTPFLEGAAQGLATLINGDAIYKAPIGSDILITVLVGIFSVNLILAFSPATGLLFLFSELLLLFLTARIALVHYQCWIDLAHPLVTVFISYYLVIPYRLVEEYKKRWHYQEKSEFMSQLEQLKTNFLSLVSHDLKTPLAQIQGNAELVLNSSPGAMTHNQTNSLKAIVQTTEGLTNYVESILDITRIEGSKVHLNKTSKDINQVILEVVANKLHLAEAKNILVKTNLEPLFSFKFDVKLIQQVVANLLENAIKYSPENSTIILESTEKDSLVRVSVKDQGYGIPLEEQEKIFTKFYRIPQTKTPTEKGTGLGLYLVKYFVELHNGFVTLTSDLDRGSVFTVNLPI